MSVKFICVSCTLVCVFVHVCWPLSACTSAGKC